MICLCGLCSHTDGAVLQVTTTPGYYFKLQDTAMNAPVPPPVRVTHRLAPLQMHSPRLGVYVVDFGQNIAGEHRPLASFLYRLAAGKRRRCALQAGCG